MNVILRSFSGSHIDVVVEEEGGVESGDSLGFMARLLSRIRRILGIF